MLSERRKILAMVRDGKVSVEEAEQMLDLVALPEPPPVGGPRVELVANSPAMGEAVSVIAKAGRSGTPVLVVGEAGAGKETVARAVHLESARSQGPFVVTDCTVVADVLQQSEIFGHEQGAFTGAHGQRQGLLETADSGTLFLVGVHALAPEVQAALENVLKGRGYTRMGGSAVLDPDVRIMAASEVDLAREVEEGRFRPYLYKQLSTLTVVVPPLRERKEDIPALAELFLTRISARDRRAPSLSPTALEALVRYDWPGNVRELCDTIQRAAVQCDGDVIEPEGLLLGSQVA